MGLKILLLLFLMIVPSISFCDIEFFSGETVSKYPHSALLRSYACEVVYIYSTMDKQQYAGFNFGIKLPLLSYRGTSIDWGIGTVGGFYSKFELFSESFNYVHSDFLGGVYFDIRAGPFTLETYFYHVSSHIGDEYIVYENQTVEDTSYEALKHYTTYEIFDFLYFSIGFEYKVRREPRDIIFYNSSLFMGYRLDFLSMDIPLFIENEVEVVDLRYRLNVGIRIGTYLRYLLNTSLMDREVEGHKRWELAVTYYYGFSREGYFYNRRESLILFGTAYRY